MLLEAGIIFTSYHVAVYIRFTVLNGVWNPIIEDTATELLILGADPWKRTVCDAL